MISFFKPARPCARAGSCLSILLIFTDTRPAFLFFCEPCPLPSPLFFAKVLQDPPGRVVAVRKAMKKNNLTACAHDDAQIGVRGIVSDQATFVAALFAYRSRKSGIWNPAR